MFLIYKTKLSKFDKANLKTLFVSGPHVLKVKAFATQVAGKKFFKDFDSSLSLC